jgi:hypothetical protein
LWVDLSNQKVLRTLGFILESISELTKERNYLLIN